MFGIKIFILIGPGSQSCLDRPYMFGSGHVRMVPVPTTKASMFGSTGGYNTRKGITHLLVLLVDPPPPPHCNHPPPPPRPWRLHRSHVCVRHQAGRRLAHIHREFSDIPSYVDWSIHPSTVTPVKYQHPKGIRCGNCSAFTAEGAVEGLNGIMTHRLVSLSLQDFLDCARPRYE